MSDKTNDVRVALRRIVDQEGVGCLKDVRRFRSLWLDYVPQSKEAKLILSAVQEGVGGILLDALDQDDAGKKRSIKRCEQQLSEAYIASDGASFAIREIASAMRMDADRLMAPPGTAETPQAASTQAAPKDSRVDRMPGARNRNASSSSGQERYPEQEAARRENRNETFPANSAVREVVQESPAKRKRKFPWLLLLLLVIGGAAAAFFLSRGGDAVPAVVPPVVVPDEQEEQDEQDRLAGVVPPVLPAEDEPAADNAVVPAPEEPETLSYEIDTIVSNVDNITAMVMNRNNTLYYISENAVYNSRNDEIIDFSNVTQEGGYLAYDPYSDSLYLLLNQDETNSTIYDITGFENRSEQGDWEPVMDEQSCPALSAIWQFYTPPKAPVRQIGVLKNGALLVPSTGEGTYMVNIPQNTVTPTATVYPTIAGEQEAASVVGDSVIKYVPGGTSATISAITGTSTTEIEFERAVPSVSTYARPYEEMNGIPMYAGKETMYCYDNSVGVCSYNPDGSVSTLIPQDSIQIKDYQQLTDLNLWGIAVGDEDHIALYDHTLKSIRMIQPAAKQPQA